MERGGWGADCAGVATSVRARAVRGPMPAKRPSERWPPALRGRRTRAQPAVRERSPRTRSPPPSRQVDPAKRTANALADLALQEPLNLKAADEPDHTSATCTR